MGSQASIAQSNLHALTARTNYAGAGGTHVGTWKIEKAAERLKEIDPMLLFQPVEGHDTTILYEAARTGAHETLCVIKLLAQNSASEEQFLRALSWRRPKDGTTALHVVTTGEAAAALLLAGCSAINSRELCKGYTPVIAATMHRNPGVVVVLTYWGADLATRDLATNQTAEEMAIWLTYPVKPGSSGLLDVFRGNVDLASYPGIQWLHSDIVRQELMYAGVHVVEPPSQSTKADSMDFGVAISELPNEFQVKAMLYDLDLSGTISFDDLDKIDPSRTLSQHKRCLEFSPIKILRKSRQPAPYTEEGTEGDDTIAENADQKITIGDGSKFKIKKLPPYLIKRAMAWDVSSSGFIKFGDLKKIEPNFTQNLVQKRSLPDPLFTEKAVEYGGFEPMDESGEGRGRKHVFENSPYSARKKQILY